MATPLPIEEVSSFHLIWLALGSGPLTKGGTRPIFDGFMPRARGTDS
jgi:hypothetical protein